MKRQNFPIPEVIDPPRVCVQIQLPDTDQHRQVFMGLMMELAYWYNWQRDDDKRGKDVAAVYKDVLAGIEWDCMSGGCGCEQIVLHRITADGEAQISLDGGANWTQDPDDPRVNVPAVPPVVVPEGMSAKCQAAENCKDQFKSAQQTFGTVLDFEAGVLAVAGAICAILAAILLDPAHLTTLIPLIISEASQLLHETNEEYNGQFGDQEYTDLLCIFLDNLSEDGTMDDDQYAAIKGQIQSKFADRAIPKNTFLIVLALAGTLGMNFFCTLTTNPVDEGSCAECECDISAWGILTNGTETSRDEVSITVDATVGGGGQYFIDLSSHVAGFDPSTPYDTNCCKWDYEITVGSVAVNNYVPCGSNYTTGLVGIADPPHVDNGWLIELKDANPFTVVFTLH